MVVYSEKVLPEHVCQTGVIFHVGIFPHGVDRCIDFVNRTIYEIEETVRISATKLGEPLV